jgi:hypothetical protein
MKKSKKSSKGHSTAKRTRLFRVGVFASLLLAAGVVTALAKFGSRSAEPSPVKQSGASAQTGNQYVTVEVGGKKLRVNAQTLQQGPLTQDQSQQIADALKGNKSTDGLVEVQHADGTVSMDLQGRFQNVMMAKKNDDGSVSEACVDNPEAAAAFLRSSDATPAGSGPNRKAAAIEQ